LTKVKAPGNEEFLLTGAEEKLAFPVDAIILDDLNVLVADTGATCDLTPKQGMCNLVKGQDKDKITKGQGDGSHVSVLGNIPGDIVSRHGEPKRTVTLKGVSHVPNANFNLFSLTKK